MEYSIVTGFVYVLANPAFPGLLKIGFTNRSVDDRMKELNSSTSVPAPLSYNSGVLRLPKSSEG
jgi:hypothetical protein